MIPLQKHIVFRVLALFSRGVWPILLLILSVQHVCAATTLFQTKSSLAVNDSEPEVQSAPFGNTTEPETLPVLVNEAKEPTPPTVQVSELTEPQAQPPFFSLHGGFYSGPLQLVLGHPDPSVTIYYTIDGRVPDTTSVPFTHAIAIDSTTAIRAAAFLPGKAHSQVVTHTYFVNEPVHLRYMSLVTDPDHLFSDQTGIYVTGTNGIPGNCDNVTPRNVNQDWERPVHIELFEPDGTRALSQGAGIKIFGGCSRTRYPQKSFSLHARRVYGDGKFRYKLFSERPMTRYDSFNLRSSSDDQVFTMLKDGYISAVYRGYMNAEYGAYEPVSVFINGVYWGLHNMRERYNHHYLADHFGVHTDSVTILRNNASVQRGDNHDYLQLRSYVATYDMRRPVFYDHVASRIDISQYIDYQIANIYMAEVDWPGNNVRFWRADNAPWNRWRWIQYDRDQSMMEHRIYARALELAVEQGRSGWPNPDWSTLLFRRLLRNQAFRNEFIQAYAWHLNTTFQPDRLIALLDKMQARIEPEMPRHIERWGGQFDEDSSETWMRPTVSSMDEWYAFVDEIRTFARLRPAVAEQYLSEFFDVHGRSKLSLRTDRAGSGTILFYGRPVRPAGHEGVYFDGVPVHLTAQPAAGMEFSHWQVVGNTQHPLHASAEPEIQVSLEHEQLSLVAHFSVPVSTTHEQDAFTEAPDRLKLAPNYPNPFNPVTICTFALPEQGKVRLEVFDSLGRLMAVPVQGSLPAGWHEVRIDGTHWPSGLYVYRLTSESGVLARTMTLLK